MALSSNPKPVSEMTDDEAIEDMIALLRKCPNPDKETIFGSAEFGTVNEMINHLERRTPVGMELLALHRRVEYKSEAEEEKEEKSQNLIQTIKGAIQRLIS